MKFLEIKNLKVTYKNSGVKFNIVDSASFCVNSGDYVCIVGKNGAGKSTLLKAILGLVPISSGELLFTNLKKCEISYVPQFCTILPHVPATVEEIVYAGILKAHWQNFFKFRKVCRNVFYYLDELKISHLFKKKISELSGGQVKKVLIARALCSEPKMLILDEPFANLDDESSKILHNILKGLNNINKITVIMVLHDHGNAKRISNKILSLEGGKIIQLNNMTYPAVTEW